MNVDFNDPTVKRVQRETREREARNERRQERIREDSKWVVCDCCLQVNCICGCKQAMMNSRDY